MALQAGEVRGPGGYIFAAGLPVFTTDTTGATMQGGLLRDPDGRLVVVYV
jgi:hypothetical protein